MTPFRHDGAKLKNSTRQLWKILRDAVEDHRAGLVVIVLDALDECDKAEFEDLVRNVKDHFNCSHSPRYLLTSRPYDWIVDEFYTLLELFPKIRIPGEEASETISKEIDLVVTYRVKQLSKQKRLTSDTTNELERSLQEHTNRTYLWVYLVFDHLKNHRFTRTARGITSAIATLPKTVNEAYEKILHKCEEPRLVRKILSAMLAASRPLTLDEANVVLNLDEKVKSIHDIDLEERVDFQETLRQLCGLFFSIYHGRIYFLHQTAREFLLNKSALSASASPTARWHQSIHMDHAHAILAEVCVIYLQFFESDAIDVGNGNDDLCESYALLKYAASYWAEHFGKASYTADRDIASHTKEICGDNSRSFSIWMSVYSKAAHYGFPRPSTGVMAASYFGLDATVRLLLEGGAEADSKCDHGRTSLSYAAEKGHEAIAKRLLESGAKVDSETTEHSNRGRIPLSYAAESGHEAIAGMLLEAGAEVDSEYKHYHRTPLMYATASGNESITKMLLKAGAKVESRDGRNGRTPLASAAFRGHEAVTQLLLEVGADVNSKGEDNFTPLTWTALMGHEAILKLLLEAGAEVESEYMTEYEYGRTPLSCATGEGHKAVIELLLEAGAVTI